MPLYFYHVRTPDRIARRAESHECPNLDMALVRAQRAARALVRNPVRRGLTAIRGSLDIEDERQKIAARLLLADVAHRIS